jgi:pimeloyl-ACP methyl ester carboxylesterase
MKNISEKNFNASGVSLNYLEGPPNGVPLILLAGQALSIESYKRVIEPLSQKYHVYAIDLRGHGKSDWTTGDYTIPSFGKDIEQFIKEKIGKPTYVSGNSSGGLVALWLAAEMPDLIDGIILEDTPLFSAEWPRIKSTWGYGLFEWNSKTIGSPEGRNLSEFFKKVEIPNEGKEEVIAFPSWIGSLLGLSIKAHQAIWPEKPVDLIFMPPLVRMMVKSLSVYDPDVTRAAVDGRLYENFDHSEALQKSECQILLLHANWFENEEKGLVGSMNDEDVERAMELAPQIEYRRITSGHMIHFEQPKEYMSHLESFIEG